ncbi:MAG: glycosyltransferase family 4 protein [Dictyoglomus turgidum]|uniref:glycosyltransferase family 4 protein n=1 Tax=Dictyoglomus turgidum TaxID=513050 RepID=UPI003C780549
MKIAFFTNNYLPNTGGAAIAVESYRDALEKLGHEVYIFAPKYPPWFPKYKDNVSERIWRFPSFAIKFITPQPIPIYFAFLVEDFFKKQKFDIVHSHHPFVIGKTALKLAKKYHIPIVFTHHTQYHKYVHYIPLVPEKISAKIAIKESVKYANQVDLVIAPTKEIKDMIINFGVKTRIEILPTGIDLSMWEEPIQEEFLRNFPWKEKRILLYAGRLAKEKNIEFIFTSLEKLLKKREDIILLVVGDGDERKNLENLVKKLNLEDKIVFMGWHPREELVNFYKIAEIFVFASTTETQGLVTLEAMAGGCAIVAIKAPGSMSLIEDGKEGFLVKEDPEEFANKVELLLNNRNLLATMQNNAKIKAREFSIDKSAMKLVEFYKELAKIKEKQ